MQGGAAKLQLHFPPHCRQWQQFWHWHWHHSSITFPFHSTKMVLHKNFHRHHSSCQKSWNYYYHYSTRHGYRSAAEIAFNASHSGHPPVPPQLRGQLKYDGDLQPQYRRVFYKSICDRWQANETTASSSCDQGSTQATGEFGKTELTLRTQTCPPLTHKPTLVNCQPSPQ